MFEFELVYLGVGIAIGLLPGLAAGRYLWPILEIRETVREIKVVTAPPESPVIHVSPGRQRVVFRFSNGFEQRKTLLQHSAIPVLRWKDKMFAKQTSDGPEVIYNEVI